MKCKHLSVALRKLKYIIFVHAFHDRVSVKRNKEWTNVIVLGAKIIDPHWPHLLRWPTSSVPMILNFKFEAKYFSFTVITSFSTPEKRLAGYQIKDS